MAIFGGTTPLITQSLIQATGNELMPAFYLMATSAVGAVAIYFLKESANRPLPGSMPSVDTKAEAQELVATQDENPLINLDMTCRLPNRSRIRCRLRRRPRDTDKGASPKPELARLQPGRVHPEPGRLTQAL